MENVRGEVKAVKLQNDVSDLMKRSDKLINKMLGKSMDIKGIGEMNSEDLEMLVECTKLYRKALTSVDEMTALVVTQQRQLDNLQDGMQILLQRTTPAKPVKTTK